MAVTVYLDFDGVLHDDAVYYNPEGGIYVSTPGRILFEWAYILEGILEPFPEATIVLSTSWVRVRSFEFAKNKLPNLLKNRVIGATFDIREMQKIEFDLMSRWQQISNDVNRRGIECWFAIDNDCTGWPAPQRDRLILTNDRLGLSELTVQKKIRDFLLQG